MQDIDRNMAIASLDVKTSALGATEIVEKELASCSDSLDVLLKGACDGIECKDMRGWKLGYRVKKDGKTVHECSYPPEGVTLVRSDQPYLLCDKARLIPNEYYELELWIQKPGSEPDVKTSKFTTAKTPQPYASWTWDDTKKQWVAPKAYPEDGKNYTWDEKTLSWVVDEGYR
jgi:hypothetical protein